MKKLFSFLAALVMAASVITPAEVIAAHAQETPESTTLRVATWNIAAKDHPDVAKLSKQFSDYDVEIAGVQEVDMFNTRNNYDMMAAFISTDYPYTHFAKGRDYANGDFGIGMVSSLPFIEAASHPLDTEGSDATKT